MTQKELLYLEDAIGHEKNIISICKDSITKLTDEELISFMQNELTKHNGTLERLFTLLKEAANGQ